VLCSKHSDLELFDAAFESTFGVPWEQPAPNPYENIEGGEPALPRIGVPPKPGEEGEPPPMQEVPLPAAWSDVELLREKDFASLTDAELALAHRLVRRIALRGPLRQSRRTRPARRRGAHPHGARADLRRTVRASLRYGGEPLERHWRERVLKPRPVVLVCDVSGSMEPYARMLLQYLQAWVAARRRAEAFVFGTRLTRVTRELAGRDPDLAVARAARAVSDWSGGTRIGESLAELNRSHGRRIGRGSVVVVLSDGWDRGEPDQLAAEMARLSRCAHSVVWLNPLKAHERYEPLTRGMQAALPHVDHFLAGNSIASLEELAELMEGGLA
jgi:uncharacterized protein with von Willebrand factor type A (vWA) domain